MIQIAQEQKYILLIAPVGRGRPQQSVAEGKTFPLLIVLICLYLEKQEEELSLVQDVYKIQAVAGYNWYNTARPELRISSAMFEGLETDGIITLMNTATMELEDWQARIFGVHDGVREIKGEIEKHIGAKQDYGSEIGRIMFQYDRNEKEKDAGKAEFEAAPWDKQIAEAPCSWVEVPSLRSVVTTATAVYSAVVTTVATTALSVVSFGTLSAPMAALCAAGIGAAITLSAEATFAVADVAGGYKDWDEVGKDLAISAATSVISAAGGAAGAAIKGIGGIGGALLKTGVSMSTSATSTVATKAILYAGDWDGFASSMASFDTWSGVITSGAGSLVTNSLSSINSFDGNKLALNGNTFNTGAISKYNGLVGGLASSALSYGLTGEATFNVLNIADIGINSILNKAIGNTGAEPVKASCGLLEVSVGNDGVKTRLGTGGIDISYGTVLAAYTGLKESARVTSWKYGGVEKSSTLNSINMLGYTQNEHNKKLSKDIWNEKLGVEYGDTGKDYGNYTVGEDKIRLSDKLLGGGKEGSAKLAAVMSHEGTHAYGNRYEGIAHMAAADTYSQINTIFNLTGDASFSNEMLKGIMNPENWKENEGDVDHWTIKMHADGSHEFINDNKKTLSIDYLDSDGNVISTSKIKDDRMNKMGWAESMVTALGSDRAEEILGSSYLNADNYDYQTLKDVLKLDDEVITRIQHRGSLEGLNITESQKNSLLGEAILKKNGGTWNSETKKWDNLDNMSLTITDKSFNGNIMAEIQNGKYLYSSVAATLFRDPDSWKSVTSMDGKRWNKNVQYYNKDTILYEKTGINWNYYDSLAVDKYQTVDNLTREGTNQPFYDFGSQQWIQGNTINSSFNMGYYTDWQKDGGYENDVLVLNSAKTVSGIIIGKFGGENNSKINRWLEHDTSKKDANGKWIDCTYELNGKDYITGYSNGCFITTRDNQKQLLNHLNNNWHFTNGIQIKGTGFNDTYSNYKSRYPNTRGLR